MPPGQNYLHLTEKRGHPAPRFKWRSRYWSFLLKLHPDRPSPTIQGQPGPWVGPFHWEDRRLRVPELKRLMTIPDDFVVCGNRRQQQLQLGNAVPPLLAEKVAGQIAAELARLAYHSRLRPNPTAQRRRSASATRSAAAPAARAPRPRRTDQPAAARASSTARSRATFRASFGRQ